MVGTEDAKRLLIHLRVCLSKYYQMGIDSVCQSLTLPMVTDFGKRAHLPNVLIPTAAFYLITFLSPILTLNLSYSRLKRETSGWD